MIIISIFVYLAFSAFIYFSFFNRIDFLKIIQYFFVITFSSNILFYALLSLLGAIDHPFLFLILEVIFCILISILVRKKKPIPLRAFLNAIKKTEYKFKALEFSLVCFIGLILIGFFIVGITTPPNNLDSLDPTHLTKVLFWLQQGTIANSDYGFLSVFFDPIGIHIQGIWLFTLGKSENLFFLVQWFSLVITVISIYKISRLLDYSKTSSLFSAIIGLSFPIVLLQSYSFQGDLSVASLILLSISFSLSFHKNKHKLDLIAAILAFVLALASKRGALLALPFIVIFLIFLSLMKNKKIVPWVAGSITILFITIAITLFITINKNNTTLAGISLLPNDSSSIHQITEKAKYNFPRYLFQFIGLDGLPRVIQHSWISSKAGLFSNLFSTMNLNLEEELYLQPGYDEKEKFNYTSPLVLNEDSSWFGPLCFLLLPLALILSLFSSKKDRRNHALLGILFFLYYTILVFLQRPGWDPFQGRYFLLAILPLVPSVSILLPRNRYLRIIIVLIILPISLFLSVNTLLVNNSKPIITASSLWSFQSKIILPLPDNNKYQLFIKNKLTSNFDKISEHALGRRTIYASQYWEQVYYSSFGFFKNITFIDPLIPEGEKIFLDINSTSLDYGLFGKEKNRILIRGVDLSQITSGYYITQSTTNIEMNNSYVLLGDNGEYKIFYVNP